MRSDLYNIDVPEVMLVGKKPTNYKDMIKKGHWLGSKKIDGYFQYICKGENGEPYMFARNKSKKTGFLTEKISHVPWLAEWIKDCLPNDTIICSEVYVPGGTSKDVTKVLGCLAEKAIARQNADGNLHFWLHDLIRYDGEDYVKKELPYGTRYSNLCKYVDFVLGDSIPELVVTDVYDSTYIDLDAKAEKLLAAGEEGMVVRDEDGLYLPGKRRPNIMFKIKQDIPDLDLVISDVLEPEEIYTGKDADNWPYWVMEHNENGLWIPVESSKGDAPAVYNKSIDYRTRLLTKPFALGWKNAFELSLYDGDNLVPIGRVASGFTDELREDCGRHPEKYIGKVCKISCMSVDKKEKSLRHPVLLEVREDKNPRECTIESIFN